MSDFKTNDQVTDDMSSRNESFLKELGSTVDNMILEMTPDENYNQSTTHKSLRWDKFKKKYVMKKVDQKNNVIEEKKKKVKNESGTQVRKTFKNVSTNDKTQYAKWSKVNRMKLQKVGEKEDNDQTETLKIRNSQFRKGKFNSK